MWIFAWSHLWIYHKLAWFRPIHLTLPENVETLTMATTFCCMQYLLCVSCEHAAFIASRSSQIQKKASCTRKYRLVQTYPRYTVQIVIQYIITVRFQGTRSILHSFEQSIVLMWALIPSDICCVGYYFAHSITHFYDTSEN